ncbi:MAG: adenylate/guanylate cyclase domain-containing protein [Candidatus Binataceae bacterium]
MHCAKCGTENPAGKKFCGDCGTPLANLCPKCGADNPAGKRFCGECGTALGTPSGSESRKSGHPAIRLTETSVRDNIEGERKTVTALFADIKGSTELEQDLDPEEARAIVDPALKLMIDAVQRYDGYVVQSTGDGIFALFGAPVAHEDHPQRALYAALRMQEELRRYSTKLVADGGNPLQCRVGVNTGEVVVRSISTGGGHVEYTPIGHTTNLASRMQVVAPVGSIAVAEPTRNLCEGYFMLKPLGPTKVKGVSEPVNVYEVTGLGPLRTRLQRSAGRGFTKFVGREREMEAMRAAADRATSGRGQIVAAMAEAGTGKSRLFFEFKAKNQSGWNVLETFSVSHGKASAYFPVIDLLHGYFGIDSGDDSRKRREKVNGKVLTLDRSLEDALPYLFALLAIVAGEDPIAQMDGQVKKRRTLDAIKRILLRESMNQPLMVIFEDLHWIDDETQAFLNLLADSIGTAKILLLVNYRPEYSHQWGSRTYYTQLRLDPLGKESADEMLTALLGDGAEIAALKRVIIEKTEGNPFFMEETVQVLLEEGALVHEGSVARLTRPIAELKIPPTVQGILAARIDRLPADAKDLLQTLAVIGREFPLSLIRAVISKPDDELNRMLNDLQLAEFIYEQPAVSDVEYTFKHGLTQEVAFGSVLSERRKELHRRTAAAIESLYAARLEDRYSELAHHYGRAGDAVKATHYLYLAGVQALARSAYGEGLAHLTAGLEFLRTLPQSPALYAQELQLQLELGSARQTVYGPASDQTEAAYTRAYEISRRGGESLDLLRALNGIRFMHTCRGAVHKGHEVAQEALEIARRINDPTELALARGALGLTLSSLAEHAQAREVMEEALALFGSLPDLPSLQIVWVSLPLRLGLTLWLLGFPDQALKRIRECEIAGNRSTNPVAKALALQPNEVHIWCGNFEVVRKNTQTLSEAPWLSEINPLFAARADLGRGWLLSRDGKPGAITIIRDAMARMTATRFGLYRSTNAAMLAEAYAAVGQIDEALRVLDDALPFAHTEELYYEAELNRLRGELLLMRGNPERGVAEKCFREAIEVAQRQSAKSWELRATTSLARLLRDTNRRDEARAILAEIYGWFTEGFDTADLKDAKALLDDLSGTGWSG